MKTLKMIKNDSLGKAINNFFLGKYYNSFEKEVKEDKTKLLCKWIKEKKLDEKLFKIYNNIRVDFGCEVNPPINNLLEYSVQIGELLEYSRILDEKESLLESENIVYKPSNKQLIF